jgi:hypothetical protein
LWDGIGIDTLNLFISLPYSRIILNIPNVGFDAFGKFIRGIYTKFEGSDSFEDAKQMLQLALQFKVRKLQNETDFVLNTDIENRKETNLCTKTETLCL